jgi:hypothetical protein
MPATFVTSPKTPPGLVPAAAYADLDAMGQPFFFEVPESGIIVSASYADQDDEGLAVDLWLFSGPVAAQTDNSAFALPPGDALKVITVIQFTSFRDANTSQFSEVRSISKAYRCPGGRMWAAVQARGALNIATLARPYFSLDILPD